MTPSFSASVQGFNASELEWVYIAPSPTYRPPHIVLSFLIKWRGGEPAENTVMPTVSVPASSTASPDSSDVTDVTPVTPSVTPANSEPAATPGSRRRRAIASEQSGMVPAELLMEIIRNNEDHIMGMVSYIDTTHILSMFAILLILMH